MTEYAGFARENIVLLTDEADIPSDNIPTRQRMLDAMRWLVTDAQPDDMLFFHCGSNPVEFQSLMRFNSRHLLILDSGHGGQVEDPTGEEEDGFNEGNVLRMHILYRNVDFSLPLKAIFPLDYEETGAIIDDVRDQQPFESSWPHLT